VKVSVLVEQWLGHVRHLSVTIGPRPPTSPREARAADYVEQVLQGLGIETRRQQFRSPASVWLPYAVATALALAACGIYPWFPPVSAWVAVALTAVAAHSGLAESMLAANLARLVLPTRRSQNVIGVIPPAGEVRGDAVVVGHLDTHQALLMHRTPLRLSLNRLLNQVGFAAIPAMAVLFAAGAVTGAGWPYAAGLALSPVVLANFVLCVVNHRSPAVPGASDNASGVGLTLVLARQLRESPLRHTRVWLVNTGCEEAGAYGAAVFFRRHRETLGRARVLVVDNLGVADAACVTHEGILFPLASDPELVRLVEAVGREDPELRVHAKKWLGAFTDASPAIKAGFPAVTFLGLAPGGRLPYWHVPEDTIDKLDPAVLERTFLLVWRTLRALDEVVIS